MDSMKGYSWDAFKFRIVTFFTIYHFRIDSQTRFGQFTRKVARWCMDHDLPRIARFIWRRQHHACHLCGALVGMNSVCWRAPYRARMTCWPCQDKYKDQWVRPR